MINTFKILPKITNRKLILPFYHAVADTVPVHLKYLYHVRSVKTFEKDLDFLLKNFQPVSIEDIYKQFNGDKKLSKNSFFLSFDDGLKEFKEFAWPVLKRKGIPAALFINNAFVDNKELFFRFKASILIDFVQNSNNADLLKKALGIFDLKNNSDSEFESLVKGVKYQQRFILDEIAHSFNLDFDNYLKVQKPYLSKAELLQLNSEGVHIGAHSINHPLFNELSENEQWAQFSGSIDWVKANFNQKINSFSFPFTDYGISAGFFTRIFNTEKPFVDFTFGTAGLKKEKFSNHLQRIPIENYETRMNQILQKQYFYYLLKAPLLKNTIRR